MAMEAVLLYMLSEYSDFKCNLSRQRDYIEVSKDGERGIEALQFFTCLYRNSLEVW